MKDHWTKAFRLVYVGGLRLLADRTIELGQYPGELNKAFLLICLMLVLGSKFKRDGNEIKMIMLTQCWAENLPDLISKDFKTTSDEKSSNFRF